MKKKLNFIIITLVLALMIPCESLVYAEDLNLSFVNLEERPYSSESLKEIELMVDGEISEVDLYVDYNLFETFTEAPYVFDLSDLSIGTHRISAVACGVSGINKIANVDILVFGDDEYSGNNWAGNWTIDGTSSGRGKHSELDGYVSPKEDGTYIFPFNGGMTDNYSKRIAIESHSFDDSHGTVARLTKVSPTSNLTHKFIIQPPTGSVGSLFKAKMDVRIDELTGGDMGFSLMGAGSVCFGADSEGFFGVDEYNERHYVSYEAGSWYTLELDVNALIGFYSAKLINCETSEEITLVKNVYIGKFTPKLIFWLNLSSSVALDVSIDNWIAEKGYATPILSDVMVNTAGDNHIINAQINTNYSNDYDKPGVNSINKDNIKVFCGNEEVVVKDVSYDKVNHMGAVITLEEDLVSQTEYSVVLSTDVQNGKGTRIPAQQQLFFETDVNSIDVTDLKLLSNENGSSITGTMVDSENAGGTKFAIISVWQEGKLMEIKVNELSWENGGVFETDKVNFEDGQQLEFSVWDGFALPNVIHKSKFN